MSSTIHWTRKATATEQFRFVSIHPAGDAQDEAAGRLARSHAVKHALARKRKIEQERGDNFRVTTSTKKRKPLGKKEMSHHRQQAMVPLYSLRADSMDPFQTLAVNCTRFQALICDCKARQALEPVFSVANGLVFQNFQSVFRTGLVDPALVSAVMFSLVFASTNNVSPECLWYRGQTIRYIREKIVSRDEAMSEVTIGAILLLAGVEARLGTTPHVEVHMRAVQKLVTICETQHIQLTHGIKRAIFWQDLHCSVLAGSSRIVDHTTFIELQWTRELFPQHVFCLPSGFATRSHLFTNDFLHILEDVRALQFLRDNAKLPENITLARISSHAGSIQSRIAALPNVSCVTDCCSLAAFISSSMLCCTPWCAMLIPPYLSTRLLHRLQQTYNDPVWADHRDLWIWLVFVGGAFAPASSARTACLKLLQSTSSASWLGNTCKSWPELVQTLQQFIWSDKAFLMPIRAFWEDIASKSTSPV